MADPVEVTIVRPVSATVAQGPSPAPTPAALHLAAGSHRTDDLESVLQKRLRVASLLMALLYLYFGPVLIPVRVELRDWLFLTFSNVAWVGETAAAVLLWRRAHLSVRTLRRLEVVIVGLPFLHQTLSDYVPNYLGDTLKQQLDQGVTPFFLARSQVLAWFGLVIGYAIVIPNTWRRCLAVVATFVAIAVGTNVGAIASAGLLNQPAGPRYLTEFGVWLTFAVLFAVYNAYRIGMLRESALKARKLGQYQLTRKLGAGGMGEVYQAEHALLKRPCAIKLIRPDLAVDPTALMRFEREVQATAALAHPNTVHIYDYGRADDGTFYCVMEYLPGLTLDKLVERHGPLSPDRAVFVARQVCAALRAAHAVGLIHRDVKPSNVIVCALGERADMVKLLDFGLVLQQSVGDDLTREGVILGTPAYMSPEQADATCAVDARSDIYSFGAMLYFLLTGKPPFPHRSPMETLTAHRRDPVPPPKRLVPYLPDDLQAVVLKCLEKAPGDRFQSVQELDAALACCECAARWTAEDAAVWWQGHPTHPAGSATSDTTVPSK